jgi:hypothetical protein
MLWTWAGSPRVLLPDILWHQLPRRQQDTLLAHELAHLRRRDHWVRWLELAAITLYWWHPLVWWAQRELEDSEEQCCDAWVVAMLPAAAEIYAEALLQTVAYVSQARAPVALGASGAGRLHHVQRRLIMILDGTAPKALSPAGRWAVLAVAAVLLPLWPTWAQSQVASPSDRGRPVGGGALAGPAQVTVPAGAAEEDGREEQIKQARTAVHDLASELARMQKRVQNLSARLQEARARLAQLEGHRVLPSTAAGPAIQAAPASTAPGLGAVRPRLSWSVAPPKPAAMEPLTAPPGGRTSQPTLESSRRALNDQGRADLANSSAGGWGRRGDGDYEQRLKQVEAKLDRLLEELKTLREGQPSRLTAPARR